MLNDELELLRAKAIFETTRVELIIKRKLRQLIEEFVSLLMRYINENPKKSWVLENMQEKPTEPYNDIELIKIMNACESFLEGINDKDSGTQFGMLSEIYSLINNYIYLLYFMEDSENPSLWMYSKTSKPDVEDFIKHGCVYSFLDRSPDRLEHKLIELKKQIEKIKCRQGQASNLRPSS